MATTDSIRTNPQPVGGMALMAYDPSTLTTEALDRLALLEMLEPGERDAVMELVRQMLKRG